MTRDLFSTSKDRTALANRLQPRRFAGSWEWGY